MAGRREKLKSPSAVKDLFNEIFHYLVNCPRMYFPSAERQAAGSATLESQFGGVLTPRPRTAWQPEMPRWSRKLRGRLPSADSHRHAPSYRMLGFSIARPGSIIFLYTTLNNLLGTCRCQAGGWERPRYSNPKRRRGSKPRTPL